MELKAFLLVFQLVLLQLNSATIFTTDDCFQVGECIESFQLHIEGAADEYDCLEVCKSYTNCNWMTFDSQLDDCRLFHNCTAVDAPRCPTCLSGKTDCIPDEPQCWINGLCVGTVIHNDFVDTAEMCLQDCQSTSGCRWFTFLEYDATEESRCFLYRDCETLDESCENCLSGERRCESGTETTTLIPSGGKVALIVGGHGHGPAVEVFSPDGNCQHRLADVPVDGSSLHLPAIAFIGGNIFSCAGHSDKQNKECWIYSAINDSWSKYSSGMYTHIDYPGTAWNKKIFIADNTNPEVFDTSLNQWSLWLKPSVSHGDYSCLLAWRDSLILFGGSTSRTTVEMFQMSSQTWVVLDSKAPFELYQSGCTVLPTDEILILGSANLQYRKSAIIYNVQENTWQRAEDSLYTRYNTALVVLGSRVFAVGGGDREVVEEFIYSSKSWISVNVTVLVPRALHSMIAVPAEIFAHLPGGCTGII